MRFTSYVILVYLKLEARSFCTVKIASLMTRSKAMLLTVCNVISKSSTFCCNLALSVR